MRRHSAPNPDSSSEQRLLRQLAPDLDENLIRKLVNTFHDLRNGYTQGAIDYPFSLRELINLVKHLRTFPEDSLENAFRSIFDFDVHRPATTDFLASVLAKHR